MSSTIETPTDDESCAYCQAAIFDHDPICMRDCTADCASPACTYACLAAHIEEEPLRTGNAWEWSP